MSIFGDCSEGPNGPIGTWDVSLVTDMKDMFHGARRFDQDISKWNVSSATDMSRMFWKAVAFDQDISAWDMSRVKDMSYMFASAFFFNRNFCTRFLGTVAVRRAALLDKYM